MHSRTIALAIAFMLCVVGNSRSAFALPTEPGFDLFETLPGTGFTLNGQFVPLTGNPTGPQGHSPGLFVPGGSAGFNEVSLSFQHAVRYFGLGSGNISNVDTIVERTAGANLPTIGSSDTVPIQIVSLGLQSVNPVNLGGSFFDVFVDLGGLPQTDGSITFTRTGESSGTFNSILPVNARATFMNTDPSGPSLSPITVSDTLRASNVPFTNVPEPSTVFLLGSGLAALGYRQLRRCRKT